MSDNRHNPYYQAQAILSHREHSIFEVRTKMKRKGFTAAQINTTVAKLKKLKLLDDYSFAHKYAEEILRFKAVGPRWVMHKLRQRGIGQAIIDEAVATAFAGDREMKLARVAATAWRKAHPSTDSGQEAKDRLRLTRFLASRGFIASAISGSAPQSADE